MTTRTRTRELVGTPLVAISVALSAFWMLVSGAKVYAALDYFNIQLPFRHYVSSSLRGGELPLWIPNVYSGAPYWANGDAAVAYPLQALFFITDHAHAVGLTLILHTALSLVAMYAFARLALGVSAPSSAASALIYAFGGYALAHTGFINFVYLQPWPPLLYLGVDRAIATADGHVRWSLLSASACALALMSGQPQHLYFSLVWLPLVAARRVTSRALFRRAVGVVLMTAAGGIALAAVQVVPQAELILSGARGQGLSLAEVSYGSLPMESPFEFMLPDFDRSFTGENAGWIGAAGVILALSGTLRLLIQRRWREVAVWVVIATTSFVLALGTSTPLFELAYRFVPGANRFRFPIRWVFMASIALAVLVAFGLDACVRSQRTSPRLRRIGVGACGVSFVVAATSVLLLVDEWSARESVATGTAIALAVGVTGIVAGRLGASQVLAGAVVVAAIALELTAAGAFMEAFHPQSPSFFRTNRPLPSFIAGEGATGRVLSVTTPAPDDFPLVLNRLGGNTTALVGLRAAHGQGGNWPPGEMVRLDRELIPGLILNDSEIAARTDLLRMFDVQWVVARPGQTAIASNQELREVARDGDYVLYELQGGDRVVGYCGAQGVRSASRASDAVFASGYDRSRLFIPEVGSTEGMRCGRAHVTHETNNSVDVTVTLPSAGWVLLADTWYPGWKADVDGKSGEIHKGNGIFRAVRVDAGRHLVRFRFRPLSVYGGMLLSAVSWLIVGALTIQLLLRSVKDRGRT